MADYRPTTAQDFVDEIVSVCEFHRLTIECDMVERECVGLVVRPYDPTQEKSGVMEARIAVVEDERPALTLDQHVARAQESDSSLRELLDCVLNRGDTRKRFEQSASGLMLAHGMEPMEIYHSSNRIWLVTCLSEAVRRG